MAEKINFFWFRRDLRLFDNNGLCEALKSGNPVQCVFIFDKHILKQLENKKDARVAFIHNQINELNSQLQRLGSSLITTYDTPEQAWAGWITEYRIVEVFTNHDYEPYAVKRDQEVADLLRKHNIKFSTFKDQVIFEKDEVVKDDGKPYTVFTPYKNKFLNKLSTDKLKSFNTSDYYHNFRRTKALKAVTLKELGFTDPLMDYPSKEISKKIINNYAGNRDFPSIEGTSRLSVHLRFGTISIRELYKQAVDQKSDVFKNELIWREFYQMILWHFPYVVKQSFKKNYDTIKWRNNPDEFHIWCEGKTGYPIVDAGMRELNQTGFMHNRVRMITASFLTKHLLIDWRWGEAYFANKLLDYELASNNGGWQWAAGCGCDAAPYFRIFNPYTQAKKFDPENKYIRKWVPEFESDEYPQPVVDHKLARERCLKVYKSALEKK